MINDLIYVYCILRTPLELLPVMEGSGLQSLKFDDFYVIVKYVPESEFSEENFKMNLSNNQWLELNAREHIMVITAIMEQSTVVPFKFGTIYHTKDSLKNFITIYSDSLIANFGHITGKEEWSVKIYFDGKILYKQINELSEEVAALEKQIMASSPGKAFLLKIKKTGLIENEITRLHKNYGQKYYDEFKNLSESISLNNLLPKEYTGREETMILNATFLVKKNRVADFINIVEICRKKDGYSGCFIEATGPWPPFTFISIKEKQ